MNTAALLNATKIETVSGTDAELKDFLRGIMIAGFTTQTRETHARYYSVCKTLVARGYNSDAIFDMLTDYTVDDVIAHVGSEIKTND